MMMMMILIRKFHFMPNGVFYVSSQITTNPLNVLFTRRHGADIG